MKTLKEREAAMFWWYKLDTLQKVLRFNEYKEKSFTPACNWKQLTGREIQIIYSSLIKVK